MSLLIFVIDATFNKIIRNIEALEDKIKNTKKYKYPEMDEHLVFFQQKFRYEAQIHELKSKIKQTDEVILKDDLKAMKTVLRRLGFLTKDNVVDVKGRVACEINASDELVLTEMLFSGFFTDLTVDEIPALLSCFVFDEKVKANCVIQSSLAGPFRQLQDIARHVAEVSKESKLDIDIENYVEKFQPHIMDVVLAWCKGSSFATICSMTQVFEGSIIRCMRRLEELLKQLVSAAKTLGNQDLEIKIAASIAKMRRDIVFAASLYL